MVSKLKYLVPTTFYPLKRRNCIIIRSIPNERLYLNGIVKPVKIIYTDFTFVYILSSHMVARFGFTTLCCASITC